MRLLKARKGDNAGDYFLGCNRFPDCKATAPIEDQRSIKQAEDAPARQSRTNVPASMRVPRVPKAPLAPGVRRSAGKRKG
jgi:ssDNA-binding Zn-finger/Zn-ribbon topoisomerase 1